MTHAEDAAGLRAGGHERLAAELERAWRDYERALERLQAPGRRPAWRARAARPLDLLGDPRGAAAARHRRRRAAAGAERDRLPPARFGERWRGGFWLPECAYAPWLVRTLEDAGVRAVCVELTGRFGLGAPRAPARRSSASPASVLVPIDRADDLARVERRRLSRRRRLPRLPPPHGPPPQPVEQRRRAPTTRRARSRSRASTPRTSSLARAPACATRQAPGVTCPEAGWSVCALDTELLGHWWYEGLGVAARRSSRSALGRASSWCASTTRSNAARSPSEVGSSIGPARHPPGVGRRREQLGQRRRPVDVVGPRGRRDGVRGPRGRASPAAPRRRAPGDGGRARAARAAGERLAVHGLPRDRRPLRARALRRAPRGLRAGARRRARGRVRTGLRNLAVDADRGRVAAGAAVAAHSQRIDAGRLAHPDHPRGHAGDDRVGRERSRHDRARADRRCCRRR